MNELHQFFFSELDQKKAQGAQKIQKTEDGFLIPFKLGQICIEDIRRSVNYQSISIPLCEAAGLLAQLRGKVIEDVVYTSAMDEKSNPDGTIGTYLLFVKD